LLAVSVTVCLLWGGVAAWSVLQWTSAANPIVASVGPLTYDAQQVYRSLSEANATEANDYLAGIASTTSLDQVHDDLSRSSADLLAIRAGDSSPAVQADLTLLSAQIPTYADLVGEADAFNREQDVVGAAWLSEASNLMRGTLLPAASDLYQKENARLNADYAQATRLPYLGLVIALGVAVAGYLGQRWLAGRTRRVLNPGLVAASLIGAVSLAWLLAGFASARSDLLAARDAGSGPAAALAQAEVTALRMHSDESLTLINRDGALDSTELDFQHSEQTLSAQLVTARAVGNGSPGAASATAATHLAQAWYGVHQQAYALNSGGSYPQAVSLAVGGSTAAFVHVDTALTAGLTADQAGFTRQSAQGDDAFGGVAAGMGVAALLMAAACTWGVSRRIAEYR
jgi:hypothetical protein